MAIEKLNEEWANKGEPGWETKSVINKGRMKKITDKIDEIIDVIESSQIGTITPGENVTLILRYLIKKGNVVYLSVEFKLNLPKNNWILLGTIPKQLAPRNTVTINAIGAAATHIAKVTINTAGEIGIYSSTEYGNDNICFTTSYITK